MDVRLPDGRIIKNVPEGTTKKQLMDKLKSSGVDFGSPSSAPETNSQPQPQAETGKSFGDRISESVSNRSKDIQAIDTARQSGEQGRIESGFQKAGVGAGLALDTVGAAGAEAFEALPQGVQDTVSSGVSSVVNTIANLPTGTGQTLGETVPAELKALADANPRAARNVKAGANILALASPQKVKVGGKPLPEIAAKATGKALTETNKGVVKTATKAIAPKIPDNLKPLAKKARDFDIPLRSDQVSPTRFKKTLQKVSQEAPFSGADVFEDAQRAAFTKAIAKEALDIDADDLSPTTIKKFKKKNSKMFDDVLRDADIDVDEDDLLKIVGLKDKVDETLGLNTRDDRILKKKIDDVFDDLSTKADETGKVAVKGQKIGSIRSDLIDKAAKAGNGSEIFDDMIETIDDILQKGVGKDAAKVLKDARFQYRNFKTLEPLINDAIDGVINPTMLLQRVKSSKFIKAADKAIGEDALIDLARIGKQFLPKLGGSDSIPKAAIGVGSTGIIGTTIINPALGASLAIKGGAGILANRGLQKFATSQKRIDTALGRPTIKSLAP